MGVVDVGGVIGPFSDEGAACSCFRTAGNIAQSVGAFGELFFDGEACVVESVLSFQPIHLHAVRPDVFAVFKRLYHMLKRRVRRP